MALSLFATRKPRVQSLSLRLGKNGPPPNRLTITFQPMQLLKQIQSHGPLFEGAQPWEGDHIPNDNRCNMSKTDTPSMQHLLYKWMQRETQANSQTHWNRRLHASQARQIQSSLSFGLLNDNQRVNQETDHRSRNEGYLSLH